MRPHIIWTILRKELTEALRDRITLFVLVVLPLLLYPLALVSITQLTKYRAASEDRRVVKVAVWGVGAVPLLNSLSATTNRLNLESWLGAPGEIRSGFRAGRLRPPTRTNTPAILPDLELRVDARSLSSKPPLDDEVFRAAREVVSRKQADAVLIVWPGFDDALERHDCGQVSVYYDSVIPESDLARSRLSAQMDRFRERLRQERQRALGLPQGFVKALEVQEADVAPARRQMSDVLGRVLPLLLIMLSVVGALVAAVDMTAGEKERATLQSLLCAPIRSLEIVAGKFLAVWSISLLSAVANLIGVGLTISRLSSALHTDIVPWGTLLASLALLLPATWTIAALFLAVAVLARDVKDAGNFLGACSFVVIALVAAALLPGVELDAWTCCVPLLNVSLLIRALLTGDVGMRLILVTMLASFAYAGLALALAARVFGREQSLLGGAFSWRWLLRGDRQRAAIATPGLVLAVFPLVAVAMFYLSLSLAPHGLVLTLLVTHYGVFFLIPVAVTVARRFPLRETFSLHRPHWRSVLGSALIGVSASVAIAGLVLRLAPLPESAMRDMRDLLQLGDQTIPLWKLLLLISLTPALCEETLFRGFLLSGLRRWGPWAAIGVTALLFGLMHGSIYRLLPTFSLGLLLGYAVWRSRSLYCSMLIHGLNNGLIAGLAWTSKGQTVEIQNVPWSLTLVALTVTTLGVALLTKRAEYPKTTARSD